MNDSYKCNQCLFCPINPNDDIKNVFTTLVDEGVYSCNIQIIIDAIKKYGHNLDYSYITWAQSFIKHMMEDNNITYEDLFIIEIEKAIENNSIKLLKEAINDYSSVIDKSYITWANSLIIQIIEQDLENMTM